MNIAYIRVSTVEQNLERQKESLKEFNINKWYQEKISAKDTNRPELKAMLEFVREGDTIYIHSIDRIARNTFDLLAIVEELERKKVKLVSIKDNLDLNSSTGKFMLTILGAVAELERSYLRERQAEGIEIAKREGKFKGRQPIKINKSQFIELYEDNLKGYITKEEMANKLDISRATLYRRIADYESEKKNE